MGKGAWKIGIVGIATGVFVAGLCSGCLPSASEQEIRQMCENLVKLRGEADLTPLDERTARIDKGIEARKADIESRHVAEIAALAKDLEAKLAELGEDAPAEERAKVEEISAGRKAEAETKKDEALARLGPDREERVAEAEKKFEEAKSLAAGKVQECVDKANSEGVTQKTASCRAEAKTTDQYWNQCR